MRAWSECVSRLSFVAKNQRFPLYYTYIFYVFLQPCQIIFITRECKLSYSKWRSKPFLTLMLCYTWLYAMMLIRDGSRNNTLWLKEAFSKNDVEYLEFSWWFTSGVAKGNGRRESSIKTMQCVTPNLKASIISFNYSKALEPCHINNAITIGHMCKQDPISKKQNIAFILHVGLSLYVAVCRLFLSWYNLSSYSTKKTFLLIKQNLEKLCSKQVSKIGKKFLEDMGSIQWEPCCIKSAQPT